MGWSGGRSSAIARGKDGINAECAETAEFAEKRGDGLPHSKGPVPKDSFFGELETVFG
jgi:hypothetical protein